MIPLSCQDDITLNETADDMRRYIVTMLREEVPIVELFKTDLFSKMEHRIELLTDIMEQVLSVNLEYLKERLMEYVGDSDVLRQALEPIQLMIKDTFSVLLEALVSPADGISAEDSFSNALNRLYRFNGERMAKQIETTELLFISDTIETMVFDEKFEKDIAEYKANLKG